MPERELTPFHRLFDRLYPLIRFFYERIRGHDWFTRITPTDGIPEELWLGGAPDSHHDYQFLVDKGIQAVLNVRAEREDDLEFYNQHDIAYRQVWVPDIGVPDVESIKSAVEWIADQVRHGKPILVHCAKGRGRSAVILAAYLVVEHDFTFEEAAWLLKDKRPLTKLESRHARQVEALLADIPG